MFSRLFKKQPAVQQVQRPRDGIEFAGQMTGTGLDALRMELAPRLQVLKRIQNGYLPKLLYPGESLPRNCLLLVESEPCSHTEKVSAAASCAGIVPMDICFASDLPSELVRKATSLCRPLLLPDLAFFECPLVVRRGSNTEMPPEWPLGVSFRYVAAPNFEDALLHAVGSAKAEGFEFVNVFQGKVIQIDHTKWWSGVVMEQWQQYADHLPSQAQVEAAVATGGLFRGPTIGPVTNTDA